MRLYFLIPLLGLVACGQAPTTEQQIISVIREMETRIEAAERRPFMSHVAEDFSGQGGSLNRNELNRLVIYQLNEYRRLNAQLFPIRVSETGEGAAEAQFRALVTGGESLIPDSGQFYDFDTRWREVDGEWLLVSADWDPVPLDEVLPLEEVLD
jgi:hypothetical protein